MKYILDYKYVMLEDLIIAMNNLEEGEVMELTEIDTDNNIMVFEINHYGLYY